MNSRNVKRRLRSMSGVSNEMAAPPLVTKAEALRRANPWFEEIFAEGKTKIRILIVADGNIAFVDSDFGLTELINKALLLGRMPWEEIKVIKAHRSGKGKGEDIPDFRFDKLPKPPNDHPLSYYDQIWLFGYEGEINRATGKPPDDILTDSELRELAKYMNNGGGVFAVGDHEDFGAALCGRVPRVRSMRKWLREDDPPPRNTELRIDTLREGDIGFQKNDQSDAIPQEIRPVQRMKDTKSSAPHDLLRNGAAAITVQPDHMHEGECIIPDADDLTAKICLDDGTKFKEYPPERGQPEGERLSPVVVAISTSASGVVVGDPPSPHPPVIPRCYKAIVAYDGHLAGKASDESQREGVGRVVVDASFHHFVDINLKGEGIEGDTKQGFYDECGNPTADYLAIKQYFRNIDLWLRPPEKQMSHYMNMLLAIRYLSPLVEEVRPSDEITIENLIAVGISTQQAIAERFSPNDATRCALIAAGTISRDFKHNLEKLLDPWAVSSAQEASLSPLLFNTDIILKLLLGGAVLGIARQLPESASRVSGVLAAGDKRQEQLRYFISAAVREAYTHLGTVLEQARGDLENFKGILDASL